MISWNLPWMETNSSHLWKGRISNLPTAECFHSYKSQKNTFERKSPGWETALVEEEFTSSLLKLRCQFRQGSASPVGEGEPNTAAEKKSKTKSHLCLTEVRTVQGQVRIQNGGGEVEKPKNQQDQLKARNSGSRPQIQDWSYWIAKRKQSEITHSEAAKPVLQASFKKNV